MVATVFCGRNRNAGGGVFSVRMNRKTFLQNLGALAAGSAFAPALAPALRAAGTAAAAPIDAATVAKWSAPYRGWEYFPEPIIPSDYKIPGLPDFHNYDVPCVYQLPGKPSKYYLSFIGFNGTPANIKKKLGGYNSFVVESEDLVNWRNPRLAMGFGKQGEFDYGGRVIGAYLYESYDIKAPRVLKKRDGKYWTLYGCYAKQGGYEITPGYEGVATSTDGVTWTRVGDKHILSVFDKGRHDWEKKCIYQPWLVEHEGVFYNFYNAADRWSRERMFGATSTDLLNWTRFPNNPIVNRNPGSYHDQLTADGKVYRDGDHWVMFFFGVGRGGAHILAAYSRDLLHWTVDEEPLYKAGGHPKGLDKQYAHKISLVFNPADKRYYLFYCATGVRGRTIGLIRSPKI